MRGMRTLIATLLLVELILFDALGGKLADRLQRRNRLFHLAVTAMHAGHVAITTVAGVQDHTARKRRLDTGQHVVAVDPQLVAAHVLVVAAMLGAPCERVEPWPMEPLTAS